MDRSGERTKPVISPETFVAPPSAVKVTVPETPSVPTRTHTAEAMAFGS